MKNSIITKDTQNYFNIDLLIDKLFEKINKDMKDDSIYFFNKHFNIKEDLDTNFEISQKKIIQISIYKNKKFPFFFIQNNIMNENFRISISFDYLNQNWGIKINIIRDTENINNFIKLLIRKSEEFQFNLLYRNTSENNCITILKIFHKDNPNEKLFLIQKRFNNIHGVSLVFFGLENHSFKEFFKKIKG